MKQNYLFVEAITQIRQKKQKKTKNKEHKHALLCLLPSSSGTLMNEIMIKWMNGWLNKWMNEWINDSKKEYHSFTFVKIMEIHSKDQNIK